MSKKNSVKHFLKLGNKYYEEKKYDLAIENYKKILDEKPNNIEALKKLADIYFNKENGGLNAIEYLKKLVALMPNDVVNINQIGVCYHNADMYKEAIIYFNKTIELMNKTLNFNDQTLPYRDVIITNLVNVYSNLGLSYVGIKNVTDSELAFKNCVKYSPKHSNAYGSLANLYYYAKKYDLSLVFYDKTIKTRIENNEPEKQIKKEIYNKSFCLLAQKNFKDGFSLYESRLFSNDIHPQTKCEERVELPHIPYWEGLQDDCNTLIVIYEQGFGDNIQYYRFILQLMDMKPELKIKYFTRDTIINVFQKDERIEYFFLFTNEKLGTNTKKVYIMSLPFYLGIDTILPNPINYININNEKVEYWKQMFKPLKRMKVGIVGTGLLISVFEKKIPLKYFAQLFDLDIDFIYISKLDEISKDPYYSEAKNIENIHFYDIDKSEPFIDTIAILKNIDLLISVDTAIIHIAGIMNVKTWCLLGYFSDWRWSNDDIPYWYTTVELLRIQKEKILLPEIIPMIKNKLINELALYKEQQSNKIEYIIEHEMDM